MSKIIELERSGYQWAAVVTLEEQYSVQCDLTLDLISEWKNLFGENGPVKNLVMSKKYSYTY